MATRIQGKPRRHFGRVDGVNLGQPGSKFLSADAYSGAYTLHGTIMIFLFTIPMLFGGFANFVMPLMIGAPATWPSHA